MLDWYEGDPSVTASIHILQDSSRCTHTGWLDLRIIWNCCRRAAVSNAHLRSFMRCRSIHGRKSRNWRRSLYSGRVSLNEAIDVHCRNRKAKFNSSEKCVLFKLCYCLVLFCGRRDFDFQMLLFMLYGSLWLEHQHTYTQTHWTFVWCYSASHSYVFDD